MLKRWLAGAVLSAALVCGAAVALASTQITVKRCGYAALKSATVAVYPWHLSCIAAKKVLISSEARHLKTIMFTADGAATDDGYAVRISGKWWVCGGRMGDYFCGYPYRPARVGGLGGGTTFEGPFSKDVAFYACSDVRGICQAKGTVWLPGATPG